jgi:hypothetical protein
MTLPEPYLNMEISKIFGSTEEAEDPYNLLVYITHMVKILFYIIANSYFEYYYVFFYH